MRETFRRYLCTLFSFYVIFGESNGELHSCENPGLECQYDANSHLDTIMHVYTMDECHQLCLDEEYCEFVTYHYDSGTAVSNMCMLFRSCDQTSTCVNCRTDWIGCDKNCLTSSYGVLDENVIEVITATVTFQDCRNLCKQTSNCSWFTQKE